MTQEVLPEEEAFFRLVHSILNDQKTAIRGGDARREQREPYPCWQLVAPCYGSQLPTEAEFREMRCFDLSANGFSYLSSTPVNHKSLVVALGNQPDLVYLAANVAHQTPLTLVGCRFTRRLE